MYKAREVKTLGDLERAVAQLRKNLPASTPLTALAPHKNDVQRLDDITIVVAGWENPDGHVGTTAEDCMDGDLFKRKDLTKLDEKVIQLRCW